MTTLLRKMWRNQSKHKKLYEEWSLAECEEGEGWWGEGGGARGGAGCGARYAGAAAVERAASAPATAKAVASALHLAKESSRKMRRVNVVISPQGVLVTDLQTKEEVLNLSIYRISFCSAEAVRARVFALVEGGAGGGDEHRAHVFVCPGRKSARHLALSLAHAFNDAYLAWQSRQDQRATSSLSPPPALTIHQHTRPEPWQVSFEGDSDSDVDEAPTRGWSEDVQPAPLVTFD